MKGYIDASVFLGMHSTDEKTRIACKNNPDTIRGLKPAAFLARLRLARMSRLLNMQPPYRCSSRSSSNELSQRAVACKNYLVGSLNDKVRISLEQVGKCDCIIWQYSSEQQDAYYPFMDNLHTIMKIERIPHTEKDIQEATKNPELWDLDIFDRLTVGMALARRAKLYPVNPTLVGRASVCFPEVGEELTFPSALEELYQKSLVVRICTQE